MQQPKSYIDYAKEYLAGQGSLEEQQAYNRKKVRAEYLKYANNFLNNQSLESAKKEKEQALNEGAIATERARKYIDAVNKHLGIAGTGYGESKAIDLYAQESQKRAEINANYNKQVNEISKNIIDDELEFSKLYNEALDDRTESLDNIDSLVVDYLFEHLTEEELNNLPYAISGSDYFEKLYNDKFIKKPSKYY